MKEFLDKRVLDNQDFAALTKHKGHRAGGNNWEDSGNKEAGIYNHILFGFWRLNFQNLLRQGGEQDRKLLGK